jgi:hypothetical protein
MPEVIARRREVAELIRAARELIGAGPALPRGNTWWPPQLASAASGQHPKFQKKKQIPKKKLGRGIQRAKRRWLGHRACGCCDRQRAPEPGLRIDVIDGERPGRLITPMCFSTLRSAESLPGGNWRCSTRSALIVRAPSCAQLLRSREPRASPLAESDSSRASIASWPSPTTRLPTSMQCQNCRPS